METEIEGMDGGIEVVAPLHVLGDQGQRAISGTIVGVDNVDNVWERQKERREREKEEGKPRKRRNHDSVIWNFF